MRRRDPYEAYAFSAVDARASQADCWLFKADDVGVQFLSLSAPRRTAPQSSQASAIDLDEGGGRRPIRKESSPLIPPAICHDLELLFGHRGALPPFIEVDVVRLGQLIGQ